MGDTLLSMLRYICGLIDSIVYILISKLYDLFIDTANLILYSQDAMDAIGKRIGLILGIVMLFRLAVSLMSYLVSPDTISDKAKGGSKIVTNIIISLILLVTINPIFEQAYKIQIKLVQSKFVEKIFFGPQADIPNVDIAYSLYSSFLTPDPQECKDLFDPYIALNTECSNLIGSITNHKISDTFRNDILSSHKLYNVLNNYDVINYKLNGYYFFDYFMIVSTLAGAVVALMLITFCMDLATRAVKLLFLQIIAPIPIIANVDPSKGSDIFKKWMKECITTYVSLFIRLILINFAVFMMTLIQTEFHEVFSQRGPLLTVLIIIGCLMFAKQAPKLIENITGIKSDGFTLNPIKKFQEQALFGKQIAGVTKKAIGATSGLAAGSIAGAAGLATGQGIHRATFSKAMAGGWKGDKFGKNFMTAYGAGKLRHKELQEMAADGVKPGDVRLANLSEAFGAESNATKVQRLIGQGKSIQTAYDTIKQQMTACDSDDTQSVTYNGQTYNRSAKTISKELDELKKTTVEKQAYRQQAIEELKQAALKQEIEKLERKANRNLTPEEISNISLDVSEQDIQSRMDSLYDSAVTAQKQKIMNTEKELEGRINAAIAGIKAGQFKTTAPSADKIISEQADTIVKLKKKSNALGASLDDNYKPIMADDSDIVMIMKQAKGIGPQASSGKMQDYTDIGKYTKKGK